MSEMRQNSAAGRHSLRRVPPAAGILERDRADQLGGLPDHRGTSLEVGSAAQLAHMFHGRPLVIINKGKTKMEGAADLVFHDSIGKVLGKIG